MKSGAIIIINICRLCTYSLGILEGVEILSEIDGCGTETGDHDGAGVPAERILQESSDLGFSVRDVGGLSLWVPKGTDDVAKGQEATVDMD